MASRSWNRVELIGNLTRDPELRYTPNGAAVCTFGLATNRTYVSEGEKKEEVDFHRLVSWNKLAELCNQLLKKGTKVFISGRLQTRSWEAQDGQTRSVTEIVVEDMIVLSPKQFSEAIVNTDEIPAPTMESPKVSEEVKAETVSPVVDEPKEKPEKDESVKTPASPAGGPPKEEVGADEDLPF